MNYFGEDGPEHVPVGADQIAAHRELIDQRRALFMRHFMVDYLELSMRRVISNSAGYCATESGFFDINKDSSEAQRAKTDVLFEKCLGKHTDSFDGGLDVFQDYLKSKTKGVISHSADLDPHQDRIKNAYLMGKDNIDPVYDQKPTQSSLLGELDLVVDDDALKSRNTAQTSSLGERQNRPFDFELNKK